MWDLYLSVISSPLKVGLSPEHFLELLLYLYFFHAIVRPFSQPQSWTVEKLDKKITPEWFIHWRPWSKFCAEGLSTEHPVRGGREKLPWPRSRGSGCCAYGGLAKGSFTPALPAAFKTTQPVHASITTRCQGMEYLRDLKTFVAATALGSNWLRGNLISYE